MQIKNYRAFSMIEVLVTLAISIIGLLGITMMQLNINKATVDSGARSHAVWVIDEIANKMYANFSNLKDYDTESFSCTPDDPIKQCTNDTTCIGSEMAKYDISSTICPRATEDGSGNTIRASAADFIPSPRIKIETDDAQRSATITVSWISRVSSDSSYGGGDDPSGRVSIKRDIQL